MKRTENGVRNYTEDDRKWIDFIKCMRNAGLSIEVLIEYVSLFRQGDSTIEARKGLFKEQRRRLIERMESIQRTLERLDYKIARYEQNIIPVENELTRSEQWAGYRERYQRDPVRRISVYKE